MSNFSSSGKAIKSLRLTKLFLLERFWSGFLRNPIQSGSPASELVIFTTPPLDGCCPDFTASWGNAIEMSEGLAYLIAVFGPAFPPPPAPPEAVAAPELNGDERVWEG